MGYVEIQGEVRREMRTPASARRVRRFVTAGTLTVVFGTVGSMAAAGTSHAAAVADTPHAQAQALYAPVLSYERATTRAERAKVRVAASRVGRRIDACDAPYRRHLFRKLTTPGSRKLYNLWNHVTLLETYQADVKPVAPQLSLLADRWASLSLQSHVMTAFAHAAAAEFRATLGAAPSDACGFVREVATHHFSYRWAAHSADGVEAARWWRQISRAGDQTSPFWRYVYPHYPTPRPGLLTAKQLHVLPNLPGELG